MLGDHHLCGQLTGEIMSARAGLKHGVPAPKRLLPKRARPGELAVFQHILIAAPDVVYQDVQPPLLLRDLAKGGLHLLIIAMVTFNRGAFARNILHVCNQAPGDVNGCAGLQECERNAFPDAATCSSYESNFSL